MAGFIIHPVLTGLFETLRNGFFTEDLAIAAKYQRNATIIGTSQMGEKILSNLS